MPHYAVLTATGEDRPGLVNEVSKFILACGCSIADSRMAVLGGHFAMLLLVSGEPAGVAKLLGEAAAATARVGLTGSAQRTRAPGEAALAPSLPFDLHAYSMDHAGIVQRITEYLAGRSINIRAMETRVSCAAHTGQPLFELDARLDVPAAESVAELRRGLAAIGAEENVDLDLKPSRA